MVCLLLDSETRLKMELETTEEGGEKLMDSWVAVVPEQARVGVGAF